MKLIVDKNKFNAVLLLTFIQICVLLFFYFIGIISPIVIGILFMSTYVVANPKKLLSPRNMVFAYYMIFYFIGPMFGSKFKSYSFTSYEEKTSYLMIFVTYSICMIFLTLFENERQKSQEIYFIKNKNNLNKTLIISIIVEFIALFFYIKKTGGISTWISNSKLAFMMRGDYGAAIEYLVFTHSLFLSTSLLSVILYNSKKKIKYLFIILSFILLYPFIGSKMKVIMLILILFGPIMLSKKTASKFTIMLLMISVFVFLIGIYQRNYTWMGSDQLIPYALNYFNTYEMLVILVRDFEPSFMKTFLLPLNKILMMFGTYVGLPFYDMSVWLTSIYFPSNLIYGGTQQWPIEADMYLSFYYFLGIPMLIIYLYLISYAYNRACHNSYGWILIYIMEFSFMVSHLRGGILIWWYFYLIPFYILVIFIYRKIESRIDSPKIEINKTKRGE